MCEPITLAAATGLMVAGAFVSAKASIDAGDYQAQVANNQAQLTEWKARVDEQAKREETAQVIAKQRSEFAARGINPNFGTPVNVQAATAEIGELDALTIRINAKNEAAGLRSQGAFAKVQAKNEAIGTALTTAGQVAKMWAPAPT